MKKITFIALLISFQSFTQITEVSLVSKMNNTFLNEDGTNTPYWGFGYYVSSLLYQRSSLPSPLLKFYKGDSVHLNLINHSPETHTIHLHGLDVQQQYDGVPSTSFGVLPNDSTTYRFKTDNVGTFLYHCHVNTNLHLALGMYGMISVKNFPDTNLLYDNGPSFNQVYHYLSSDMYLYYNYNVTSPGPFYYYKPDYFMINGLSGVQMFEDTSQIVKMNIGDTALLHLANVGYTASTYIFPAQCNAKAHLSDGRVLPSPIIADTLILYPGERYSVLLTPQQQVSDYITINYSDLFSMEVLHTNYIGVNISSYPNEIKDNKREKLFVYPNPSKGVFTILSNFPEEITLLNISGEIVAHYIINPGTNKIDINVLSEGMYIIKSSLHQTSKIILSR